MSAKDLTERFPLQAYKYSGTWIPVKHSRSLSLHLHQGTFREIVCVELALHDIVYRCHFL